MPLRWTANPGDDLRRRGIPALGHDFIDTGHLLLGLLRAETSMAAIVLRQQGVNLDACAESYVGFEPLRRRRSPLPLETAHTRAVEHPTLDEQAVQAAAFRLDARLARLQELVEGAIQTPGDLLRRLWRAAAET